jgi:membrane-associated phospholipid phosphatase
VPALWLLALGAAVLIDRPVAEWMSRHQPIRWDDWQWKLFKRPGDFRYTAAVVVLVALLHRRKWRAGLLLLAASATAGLLYNVKWFIGRHRPKPVLEPFSFYPFTNGLRGLLTAENLSFPSGHTCLAFASAHALAYLIPRWRWAFYAVAALVGVERIGENAHYCSDVVAGAALGVFSAYLARRLIGPRLGFDASEDTAPSLPM